tara:strand:+ start:29451 stop:33782 length:4332 start_codon:yes stop_codon:yes gene_type:complete
MEDGIIYTFGDIDALVVIFDGLRMLFDPAVTTFFSVTGGLGLGVASTVAAMIALIGTMNQYISQQQLQMQGPLVGLFIYALVAIPTVDRMYVSDINTGKTLPIYDVPIGLGVVGYGMSLISYRTSVLMETAFQTVAIEGTAFESTMTGGSGFLSPVKMLYSLRTSALKELDEHLVYNMFSYTKYCLHKATADRLTMSPIPDHFETDVMKRVADPFAYMMDFDHIDGTHNSALAEFLDPTTGEESFQTCEDIRTVLNGDETAPGSLENYLTSSSKFGASRLKTLVSKNENAMQTCADGGVCLDNTTAITSSFDSAGQLLGGVANARTFFRLRVIRDFNTLVDSARDIDANSAMMAVANINESIQTTQLQEALEAETFINFMIPAMNFIIMLFYALFPLAMLIMITKGMGASAYLAGYLLIGIWGYSIIPVATAINYLTIANTREALSALMGMEGFTPFGYDMMVDTAANYLSVGSNMLAAAPIVTLAVITGSVFALTSVASGAAAPSGGASGVAGRASPQATGQNTLLGLSPHMTDVQGSHNISPVEQRSAAVAESFKVSSSYNNTASQKGVEANVSSAQRDLVSATSQTTSNLKDIISRSSSSDFGGSEKTLLDAYQKSGAQFLRENNISTSGMSKEERTGLERSVGYVNSVTAGVGASGSLGTKWITDTISDLTGGSVSTDKLSDIDAAVRSGQTDPTALPGTAENPNVSAAPSTNKKGGGAPGFNINASLNGSYGRVGADRDSELTSNTSSNDASASTGTGHEGQVTTSNGVSTANSGGVRLSQEEQVAISEHQASLRQESADYKQALENQRRHEQSAEKAQQFSQRHDYDLNDVHARNGYTSVQAVKDHFNDMIETGLRAEGFTDEQIKSVQDRFHSTAETTRAAKVPGGNDALSYLIGGAYGADEAAFDYGRIAKEPLGSGLSKDQALAAQNVLSSLDSKLFEPLIGSSALQQIDNLNSDFNQRQEQTAGAGGVRETVENRTGGINPDGLGPGAQSTSLGRVNDFLSSLSSSRTGAELSSAISGYFSPQALQNTINSNAAALGVEQGTSWSQLDEGQQNKVLAEQMNTALKEVPQSLGIDASKHQGPIDFQAQAGVHETNDLNNQGAINGGKRIFNDMASDFQSTADKKEGNIRQTEDWYQKVDKEQLAGMMSGFAFGADSSFIKSMAQHVPGGERGDDQTNPNTIGGTDFAAPLPERQEAWNTSLRAHLGNEIAENRLSGNEANLIYNAHAIEKGSDVTPTMAYAGLVAGNVAGNYEVKGAGEAQMDTFGNWLDGVDEKARGTTVERLGTQYAGAQSPIASINAQRDNMNLSSAENLQYLQSVRNGVAANGGDVSEFSDKKLKEIVDSVSGGSLNGSNLQTSIGRKENLAINDTVEGMISSLPGAMSGRDVGGILQSPLMDIHAQRYESNDGPGTSVTSPSFKITDGLDDSFTRFSKP